MEPDAHDDLARDVYGLLGVPVDAIDFPALLDGMGAAAGMGSPFLISTPNVNFLVKSQESSDFRETLLLSDLCLVDGMPLIWIAKMLGIPIHERVAGSDLFERLKRANEPERRLRVFLLGGAEDLVARVGAKLNAEKCGLQCVGVLNPGFGTIDEMSTPEIINTINASEADLLAVFFGAEKAQAWLIRNHWHLRAPIRAQFGATINFEAGTVRRAPPLLRSTGFEWLWRIKEEPYLWRRYWNDGLTLLRLFVTCVLPMSLRAKGPEKATLSVEASEDDLSVRISLMGAAVAAHADGAVAHFRTALKARKPVVIDLSQAQMIDARFFGVFLMVRKNLARRGLSLRFTGVSSSTRRTFRLNRFEFLLSHEV
ncbi:MAG: WecB/TagA/CpsF family glycosyltransferase [Bradyrhizobium sp.]|nr:WecB/TagA/CpsF family glycosyltransferase [Bradyrhizobium sp.]